MSIEIRTVVDGYNWTYYLNEGVHHSPGRPLSDEGLIRLEAETSAKRRIDRLIDSGTLPASS